MDMRGRGNPNAAAKAVDMLRAEMGGMHCYEVAHCSLHVIPFTIFQHNITEIPILAIHLFSTGLN